MEENNNSKINTFSSNILIREVEGEFYTEGFIMTTHLDRAREDGYDNTMFTKEFCEQVVNAINEGGSPITSLGSRRTVSIQHDWIKEQNPSKEPIGMAVPPAELRELEGGHYGVYCRTHLNKLHEDFEDVKYKIEHGYYPGYSIEFIEGDSYGTNLKGRAVKIITELKEFLGYAYASARLIANPKALITSFGYREIMEDNKVAEEEKKVVQQEETTQIREEENVVEEPKQEESEAVEQEAEPVQEAEEEVNADEEVASEREAKLSVSKEEILASIRESDEFKQAINDLSVKSRVVKQSKEEQMEGIKLREMQEALSNKDMVSYRQAAIDYVDEHDMVREALSNPENFTRGFKSNLKVRTVGKGFQAFGSISVRGTLDSASNTSSYTQQPVEFADVFQPMINDIQNSNTNLYGFLEKENHVGGSYVQWKNVVNRDPSSNESAVDFDSVTVSKNHAGKINLQTPLKVYRRGISVADTTLRYSSEVFGDLFAREVEWQMKEMLVDIEEDMFAEAQDGAGNAVLGLEAVADTTGNTTLYGLTRSATTNFLTTGTLADTYVNQAGAITEAAIRNGIQKLETLGSQLGRLALVTSPKGKNYLFNLLDGNRRFNTTAADFGFNQMQVPSYDGIPIVTSWKCNSTLATAASSSACLYIVDMDQDKIVVGMAPTLVGLGKTGAATEAYVETNIAHVYKDPRKIHMVDNFTTG